MEKLPKKIPEEISKEIPEITPYSDITSQLQKGNSYYSPSNPDQNLKDLSPNFCLGEEERHDGLLEVMRKYSELDDKGYFLRLSSSAFGLTSSVGHNPDDYSSRESKVYGDMSDLKSLLFFVHKFITEKIYKTDQEKNNAINLYKALAEVLNESDKKPI